MFDDQLTGILTSASFALSLFGFVFCLLQDRAVWSFRTLAGLLALNILIELYFVPWPIQNPVFAKHWDATGEVLWLFALTGLAPMFWHYVQVLTSVQPRLPQRLWLHLLLPGCAVVIALLVAVMPQAARDGLFVSGVPLPTGWPLVVGWIGEVLALIAILQWGVYIGLIVRLLLRYRRRLHSYVADTARHELRWIWAVIITTLIYWITSALDAGTDIFSDRSFISDWVDALLSLILLSVILLWGLRQRPALAPDIPTGDVVAKYEKSALTDEAATRIERKLRSAMVQDKLHHDPNLSLWSLARHTGASSNYISQTLNENIGESFFDFVNSYRIQDAQEMLKNTNATVLTIAYEVGFNSRSSFYTAFKKNTGQTPTAYRRDLSVSA